MEEYIDIGSTKKPHGIDGDIKVHVEDRYLEDFLTAEVVFLDVKGGKVPYFIEEIRDGNNLLVKFEEIDTREDATELSAKSIYLRASDLLPGPSGESRVETDYRDLEGFQIHDREAGMVGVIGEVVELPQQFMAVVAYQGRDLLIPLNGQFITGIDKSGKIVEMDLPEGLLRL